MVFWSRSSSGAAKWREVATRGRANRHLESQWLTLQVLDVILEATNNREGERNVQRKRNQLVAKQ